jgi:cytochrome P450
MQTTAIPPGPAEGFDLGGSEESLFRLQDYFARFGDVYRIFAPARGVYNYVINHPEDIKRVLLGNHRNYTKGEGMDRVKILLGNGIMTSEGAFWRRQRRMMQPSFHRRVIDQFSGLIGEVNEKFARRWEANAASGEAVNVSNDASELTLEIVLRSIFGSRLEVRVSIQVIGKTGRRIDPDAPPHAGRAFRFSEHVHDDARSGDR